MIKAFSRGVASSAFGIAAALLLVALFGILSGFFLSHERLVQVARTALERGELPHTTPTNEDFFTECATLEMQYLRPPSLIFNVVDTRLVMPENGIHPCQMLRTMVTGSESEKNAARINAARSYPNYPYGSRHLEAIVLSFLEFQTARTVYLWLSYLSVLSLTWAAWRYSKHTASALLPLWLLLAFGFSLHFFGNNLAHAPGFIFGFLGLTIFLSAKQKLREFRARLFFFGALGVIVTYFDILTGAIPVVLSLSIVLNHFFRVEEELTFGKAYWTRAILEGLAITACFIAGYVALTVVRLEILSIVGINWHPYYFSDLMAKFGAERAGQIIGLRDNILRLWLHRWQLTPGGARPATWLMMLSVASWMFALGALPALWFHDRKRAPAVTINLLVLIAAGSGMLAWYICFPAHTYQHVMFIVRTITLPVAYGMVAGVLVMTALLSGGRRPWWSLTGFLLSLLVATILLNSAWPIGMPPVIFSARFITETIDKVSCAPLGLKPDGTPDGVVEIVYQPVKPFIKFLSRDRPIYIRLDRANPTGGYETGQTLYVLGVASSLTGGLLNEKDGSFISHDRKRIHLFAYFCRDGYDRPDSVYQIYINGQTFPVGP